MPNDALAQAIAEREAAWQRYAANPWHDTDALQDYFEAVDKLRCVCPHPRFEERGYGAAVCVVCGESQ